MNAGSGVQGLYQDPFSRHSEKVISKQLSIDNPDSNAAFTGEETGKKQGFSSTEDLRWMK